MTDKGKGNDMPILIHGKEYKTVAERLVEFHKDHGDGSITTSIEGNINGVVTVKAIVKLGDRIFTGHASEKVGSNNINSTSALENAETSAVGRALAFAGYAGSEIASADEVANAISGQQIVSGTVVRDDRGNLGKTTAKTVNYISEAQRKRLYAISMESGIPQETLKEYMKEIHSIEHSTEIEKGKMYDEICDFAQNWTA